MRWLSGACLSFFLINSSAIGQELHLTGVGAQTCGASLKQFKENAIDEVLHFYWAQGYMSGLNSAYYLKKEAIRNLGGWPLEQQQRQIRLHCERLPLSLYYRAVFELYSALPEINSVMLPLNDQEGTSGKVRPAPLVPGLR